ncbi:zinc finger MYM-type protein 3-like [Pecten maximus]|uniref:zinc finger MYM-type protein 3-like n=1 Tax=Pecten maximus TaxID=6579 RepID=UPI00145816ED|nr:zinc finger MYM-type protein 3-like [Pecten maximus]
MSKRNENTVKKTEGCIKRFQEWIQSPPRYDSRDVLQILPFELDTYIGGFLLSLQKNDGSNYKPDTLTSFHRGINRCLRENGYLVNILTSDLFSTSRQVLQSRRKELKQKGLGNRPNKAQPVSENEEEILWECGQHALLNTVWFNNTKRLGFGGCYENRQLKWGDIELKTDENGSEYLEFNEITTKTRGGNSTHVRSFNPKQFQNPEIKWRCPIEAYKLYAKHRPQAMNTPESPFYIAVNQNSTGGKWFKNEPVRRNKLGVMMKTMASNAGLTGKKTNQSLRKTLCTKLIHSGVAPTTIMQVSGHKNVNSVINYAVASLNQQREMCETLQNVKKSAISSSVTSTVSRRPMAETSHSQNLPAVTTCPREKEVQNLATGMFSGANIRGGTFNISFQISSQSKNTTSHSMSPPRKYRRIAQLPDSDSDD